MLFGTFRNPRRWEGQAGFWDGASSKMGSMLIGRDVGEPTAAKRDTTTAWMHPQQS